MISEALVSIEGVSHQRPYWRLLAESETWRMRCISSPLAFRYDHESTFELLTSPLHHFVSCSPKQLSSSLNVYRFDFYTTWLFLVSCPLKQCIADFDWHCKAQFPVSTETYLCILPKLNMLPYCCFQSSWTVEGLQWTSKLTANILRILGAGIYFWLWVVSAWGSCKTNYRSCSGRRMSYWLI